MRGAVAHLGVQGAELVVASMREPELAQGHEGEAQHQQGQHGRGGRGGPELLADDMQVLGGSVVLCYRAAQDQLSDLADLSRQQRFHPCQFVGVEGQGVIAQVGVQRRQDARQTGDDGRQFGLLPELFASVALLQQFEAAGEDLVTQRELGHVGVAPTLAQGVLELVEQLQVFQFELVVVPGYVGPVGDQRALDSLPLLQLEPAHSADQQRYCQHDRQQRARATSGW